MTRVTLWQPEMSLPPRLLSADDASFWKYQQYPKNSITKMQETEPWERVLLFTWYIVHRPINLPKRKIT